MFSGNKKQKTPLELLEKELEWLHRYANGSNSYQSSAWGQIQLIHSALIKMLTAEYETETQKKIRDLQETVAEIILVGSNENKQK